MSDALLGTRALRSLLGDWKDGGGPLYQALFDRIRLLVLDGRIPAGTRLPAERELAQALEVSRTLVTSAYRELREGGYTTSVRGSGSVARVPGRASLAVDAGGGFLDFTKAVMPASPGIALATEQSMDDFGRYLQGPGYNFEGIPELRDAVAERYTARGLPTTPDQILVTTGAQAAIALLSRVLLSRGDRALVELPSYPHAYEALALAGARLAPVSVTPGEGWDESALEQLMRRTTPAVGYLMPDFHNPTGESMSVELRERVIDQAMRAGTTLLIDETSGELDIDREGSFLPFAAYATPGDERSVVSIGSVGKTIWDGLRVGWIRAEPGLIRTLAAARPASDLGTPILEQLIVTRMLGDMPAILEGRREQLRAGRDRLQQIVATSFPSWSAPPVAGGIASWVALGSPVSSQLALAARAEGLLITAGPRFGLDGALERFLRIPLGYPTAQLEQGMDALGRAWQAIMRNPVPGAQAFGDVA
ncbi:PLP-dependent aminotransferase family protein [Agreia sp. VKM Ac-1783]|uniref:MocR-like transcription factor YczR n=1 Tax=Agreia sp. VKM Ac-1783 TaxID=1938889 RepID=UPI000A2AE31A|nr:PLP-dependent aminotransferase family protein [Agreia sp. VKM Ac-1783]SMQ71513.1 transcriptional regulator, GntR family [Agreia sp. VKM Ac-1783]